MVRCQQPVVLAFDRAVNTYNVVHSFVFPLELVKTCYRWWQQRLYEFRRWHQVVAQDRGGPGWWHQRQNRIEGGARHGTVTGGGGSATALGLAEPVPRRPS